MGTIKRSFTLIEIVIVVGVIGLVLPVLFGIVFTILKQQLKIYALMEVKRQGDFASNKIKYLVKQRAVNIIEPTSFAVDPENAIKICPVLPEATPTPFKQVYFSDRDLKLFSFTIVTPPPPVPAGINIIASSSASNNIVNEAFTNSKVTIENFAMTCYRTNVFSAPIFSYSFKVKKTGGVDESVSLYYQSKIKLQKY